MAAILAVGIITLDIINIVDHYPEEDEELRVIEQRVKPGGNACNTHTVLAQFNHKCYLAATLTLSNDSQTILRMLNLAGINTDYCEIYAYGKVPTSYILMNQSNGSRTIVHHRDLEELGFGHFKTIPIETFDWLHFEGRNIKQLGKMLKWARKQLVDQPISLEIEKDRPGIDNLFGSADILIIARAFLNARGFQSVEAFIVTYREKIGHAIVFIPWGEKGAFLFEKGVLIEQPAFPPARLVDSLGAGDTFNAGIIHALVSGQTPQQALKSACQLAGTKCGIAGLDNLPILMDNH